MPDPQTPNLLLNIPAHLSDPGTWDSSLNANFSKEDNTWGGVASIDVGSGPVTLVEAEWQCVMIDFMGNQGSSDVLITFPTLGSNHICRNNSDGTGNIIITNGGGRRVALPPGEWVDIITRNGGNVDFRTLYVPIGGYWDYAGTSVPSWVNACTIPPFLLCDGSALDTGTYSRLAAIIGGTLPDSQGRARFSVNNGTNRITVPISGIDGDTRFAAGGDQRLQQHNHGGNTGGQSNTHQHLYGHALGGVTGGGGALGAGFDNNSGDANQDHTHPIPNSGAGNSQNMPPAYIGGITMIRAF